MNSLNNVFSADSIRAAFKIYKSQLTLDEKISAYESIISKLPDSAIPDSEYRLHEFLKIHIKRTRGLVASFMDTAGGVYSYSILSDEDGWIEDGELYSSYERVMEVIRADADLDGIIKFRIQKRWIDLPASNWWLDLSPSREVLTADNSCCIMPDEDYEILYGVFEKIKETKIT